MMRRRTGWFFLILSLIVMSCRNSDKKAVRVNDSAGIFPDYQVKANEGDDNITILLLYRDGGEEEDGKLFAPGAVTLDGEVLVHDSAKIGGYFYEAHKPLADFSGKHRIVFNSPDKGEFAEEFDFSPMELITALPDSISRDSLILELSGIENKEFVRVLLTDTSYINDGVNSLERVIENRIIIGPDDLLMLSNGPVQLELIREYERPVRKSPGESGRFRITYALKREFYLKD